jgi:hypothetical protein
MFPSLAAAVGDKTLFLMNGILDGLTTSYIDLPLCLFSS